MVFCSAYFTNLYDDRDTVDKFKVGRQSFISNLVKF